MILIVGATLVALNRDWLYDFYRGQMYQPSSEMTQIRTSLQLTERGLFLFNASQPELNESEDFNNHCRENGTETAILGCFTNGRIYVYNITDARLSGIRELTTAHELLHAVFSRMDDVQKNELRPYLEQTYEDNKTILEEDLNIYDESEKFEELYVRVGTEVANLPEELEKHYAEIFKDQDAVVAYYDKYINVFRELQAEIDGLKAELEVMGERINQKSVEYEDRVRQLNADITSFNSCAEVVGCFNSETEFENQRNALIKEQTDLEALYTEVSAEVEAYNIKVEIYNSDITKGEQLNMIINSSVKPQEIKEE